MITTIILIVVFIVAGFMLGFGDGGRGTQSRNISTVAGLIWLAGIIYAFVAKGWKYGLIAIVISFVISAIMMNIGKATVGGLRK